MEKTFINNIMSDKEKSEVFLNNIQSNSCIICFNSISDEEMCVTNCEHKYCLDCLNTWFNRGNISCPFCRQVVKHFFRNNEKTNIIKVSVPQQSTITGDRTNIENRIINQNNIVIDRRKLVYFKICTLINISFVLYLQYRNYYLYNSYHTLYNNCSGI